MKDSDLEEQLKLSPQFEKRGGVLPVVVQELTTMEVLMLGYVNQEALNETLKSGYATFWSTSRQEIWTKGKTSGDLLKIRDVYIDCDQDAFVYVVELVGDGTCHTKNQEGKTRKSCFYRKIDASKDMLEFL